MLKVLSYIGWVKPMFLVDTQCIFICWKILVMTATFAIPQCTGLTTAACPFMELTIWLSQVRQIWDCFSSRSLHMHVLLTSIFTIISLWTLRKCWLWCNRLLLLSRRWDWGRQYNFFQPCCSYTLHRGSPRNTGKISNLAFYMWKFGNRVLII